MILKDAFDKLAARGRAEFEALPARADRPKRVAETLASSPELSELRATLEQPNTLFSVWGALLRANFIGALEDRQTDLRTVFDRVVQRAQPYKTVTNTLLLLDWCSLAADEIRLSPTERICRIAPDKLAHFGPPAASRELFFPDEAVAGPGIGTSHFLIVEHEETLSPSSIVLSGLFGDPVLHHWRSLLPIALFQSSAFRVALMAHSEPGWRLRWVRRGARSMDLRVSEEGEEYEVPLNAYEVDTPQIHTFQEFVSSVRHWVDLLPHRPFAIAARRFIRATFITSPGGDIFYPEEREDAVLHYAFALEALFGSGGGSTSLTDKASLRVPMLIAEDDEEAVRVRDLIRAMYRARSAIVHGGKGDQEFSLYGLRSIVRRALVAYLAACRDYEPGTLISQIDDALLAPSARAALRARVAPALSACAAQ
jgi:hypothetical protein